MSASLDVDGSIARAGSPVRFSKIKTKVTTPKTTRTACANLARTYVPTPASRFPGHFLEPDHLVGAHLPGELAVCPVDVVKLVLEERRRLIEQYSLGLGVVLLALAGT